MTTRFIHAHTEFNIACNANKNPLGEHCWHRNSMVVMASIPPQWDEKCCFCGLVVRVSETLPTGEGHGPYFGSQLTRSEKLRNAERGIYASVAEYLGPAAVFHAHPNYCERISWLIPEGPGPEPRGAKKVLKFFGVPVVEDSDVPDGWLYVFNSQGERIATARVI